MKRVALNALLVALFPLAASACGELPSPNGDGFSLEGADGPPPEIILFFDVDSMPEPGSLLELGERDAARTQTGDAVVSDRLSGTGVFPVKFAVAFEDLSFPYCLLDDVVLNENGDRSVVVPAGEACIEDKYEAAKKVRLPFTPDE